MSTSFDNFQLEEEIVKALQGLRFEKPTEVQSKVIPVILEGKDVIVKSQTGSGKTAAFGIPLCHLVNWEENKPQALILTPTRELAVQVKEDLMNIGRHKKIKATAVFGKQPFQGQKLALKQKNHMVVGTPGRVLDHLNRGTLLVDEIRYLVIDEADEMLNMGFIEQVESIIEKLPKQRVTLLFSATMPEDIQNLCLQYMKSPQEIEIQATGVTTDRISHVLYDVDKHQKYSLLRDLLTTENPVSSIIFCNTKQQVDTVYEKMKDDGYRCDRIHGGLKQEDRLEIMQAFRRGRFTYLVATGVAARGIDIDDITHVFNYDFPFDKENYVHRTGRTGRAGKKGLAISFVTQEDMESVDEVEEYIGFEIQKKSRPSKERVQKQKEVLDNKRQVTRRPVDKTKELNKDIMKLYFNGGKKKKLRAVDFVGTICSIPGITSDDIGVIEIQDVCTYVEIHNGKGIEVRDAMKKKTIKGKLLKVHKALE